MPAAALQAQRRRPRRDPKGSPLFAAYRYHAVFTDSGESMLAAEATHRDHAIIEQVIAELKNGPLADRPSGVFTTDTAWLSCAAIAPNLTRAAAPLQAATAPEPAPAPARTTEPAPALCAHS